MLDNLENRLGYWFPLLMLVLVGVTGLMLEGARINATHPDFTEWAYVGRRWAASKARSAPAPRIHRWLWLVHVLLVYRAAVRFPFTKLRHFFVAPINLFFRNLEPRGRLRADQGLSKPPRPSASRRSSSTPGSSCSTWPRAWNAGDARSTARP